MNEDAIADLKQFIAATISQQLTPIKADLERIEQKVNKLEERAEEADLKLNTIADTIGAKMDEDKAKTTNRLDNHEARITKLETQTA